MSYALMGVFALATQLPLALLFYDPTAKEGPVPGARMDAWLAASFCVDLVQAFLGGVLCARIGKRVRAIQILAGVVLAMGVGAGVLALILVDRFPQPAWFVLSEPGLDASAVLLCGLRALNRKAAAATAALPATSA